MNTWRLLRFSRRLALLAGLMDASTGLGLIVAPALTLRCMRAPVPGAEALLYVRFVGVFVGTVGASYLIALARGGSGPLRMVFGFTLPFRAGAGLFTGTPQGGGFCMKTAFRRRESWSARRVPPQREQPS